MQRIKSINQQCQQHLHVMEVVLEVVPLDLRLCEVPIRDTVKIAV